MASASVRARSRPTGARISWHIPQTSLRGGTNEISFVVEGAAGPDQKPPAVQFVQIVRLAGPR